MIKLYEEGAFLINQTQIIINDPTSIQKITQLTGKNTTITQAKEQTISYAILSKHNTNTNIDKLKLKFDAMASHDITYVGIVQTARASGLEKFPIPYVLTNCHNSLCAVGGTINEDDHMFGLSAAKKYGGIYVPAHQAVIHQYMREMMAGAGKMILGSDSHTRYGALGTMAIGEGGGELAKQLLQKTYDINYPEVVGVYLTGKPQKGIGPQDVALAIIGAVFENGFVKNKVMEFIGDGITSLNVEYRNGIDVMTTETTCLTSIWSTDNLVEDYYNAHGRPEDFKQLTTGDIAYYDSFMTVDLSEIQPMIAMPFHPSNVFTIDDLNANLPYIINDIDKNANLQNKIINKRLQIDQGVIAGCAGGTFDNICDATDILENASLGGFSLSVYPSSQPTFLSLVENGTIATLMATGATVRSAFCGPCFGAGDVPANNQFSLRHTTRNFPSREGSKPSDGQIAYVALADARTVAATALNKGVLTKATDLELLFKKPIYYFKKQVYENSVYFGTNNPKPETELVLGPNIIDWPSMPQLSNNLLLKACSIIHDAVTTTDELIPSGETSSYRSNPLGLAEFTLSRKDPLYVKRAKQIQLAETQRLNNEQITQQEILTALDILANNGYNEQSAIGIGSFIYAKKPGDGSAREQAASCQKVLGGYANIATQYATKRYRSNLINWGMLPFILEGDIPFELGDYIFIPDIRNAVATKQTEIKAFVLKNNNILEFSLTLPIMTDDETKIILAGSLINYYRSARS